MSTRIPVTVPVTATVSPISLRLFPYDERVTQEGTHYREQEVQEYPWAWGALVRVTFHFDRFVTTKRITQRWVYWGASAFGPTEKRPSEGALAEGREGVLRNLRTRLEGHGIILPDDHPIEVPE